MKAVILFGLVAIAASAVADEVYTDKYDDFDIGELKNNDRLAKNYIICMKNKGPCTPEGKELKAHLVEALETDCAKCTEKQKSKVDEVLDLLIHKYSKDWEELKQLYDPENKFSKKYEDRLAKIKQG